MLYHGRIALKEQFDDSGIEQSAGKRMTKAYERAQTVIINLPVKAVVVASLKIRTFL